MKWWSEVRHGLRGAEGTSYSMTFCVWQQMASRTCSLEWQASAQGPQRLLLTLVTQELFLSGACERSASDLIHPHSCSHGLLHGDCHSSDVIWHSISCQFSLQILLENYFFIPEFVILLKKKRLTKGSFIFVSVFISFSVWKFHLHHLLIGKVIDVFVSCVFIVAFWDFPPLFWDKISLCGPGCHWLRAIFLCLGFLEWIIFGTWP